MKATGGKGKSASREAIAKSIEMPVGIQERISRKAYELCEQCHRKEGTSLSDWLEAEQMVMETIK